ncbi:hypothetical protein J6590_037894 [Homalodisca vitripennis]|nr:hypothetical protein J6590_037894 [Homalodisca vitripennis]
MSEDGFCWWQGGTELNSSRGSERRRRHKQARFARAQRPTVAHFSSAVVKQWHLTVSSMFEHEDHERT